MFAKNVNLGKCKEPNCTNDRILFSNCCEYHTEDLPDNVREKLYDSNRDKVAANERT